MESNRIHKEEIQAFLTRFVGFVEQESTETYRSVANSDAIKKAVDYAKVGNQESFYFSLMYPFQNVVEGLLAEVTSNNEAQFLLKHGDFVKAHFKELIQKFEGYGLLCR